MKNTLSIYGSHDASVTFVGRNDKLVILEYERFVKQRYAAVTQQMQERDGLGTTQAQRIDFFNYVKSKVSEKITKILYNELNKNDLALLEDIFPGAEFKLSEHHRAHAACGYFQSGFSKAIILSIDGGGNDFDGVTTTRSFLAQGDKVLSLEKYSVDLGNAYALIGAPISEIRAGPDSDTHSLVYAGKVMGLCAYGNVREEWIEPMKDFYKDKSLVNLGCRMNLRLSFNSLSGQDSYDLAATSQFVFESIATDLIMPLVTKYLTNVVLVGGCALNVLFNQKLSEMLHEEGLKLYVPPNPSDCGLSLGQLLLEHPQQIKDIAYSGLDLLDLEDLAKYVVERCATRASIMDIVDLLKEGKLIGIVGGGSEVGPRALGNRSIICDPAFPGIKDTLNSKVKFREWYRPFAPVARIEDAPTYFENVFESPFMTLAPTVKEKYKKDLAAITHVDGTARLQTVGPGQHPVFRAILSELSERGEVPVILNTSFNIRGAPILSTIKDALYVLDHTELDYVAIEGFLFKHVE